MVEVQALSVYQSLRAEMERLDVLVEALRGLAASDEEEVHDEDVQDSTIFSEHFAGYTPTTSGKHTNDLIISYVTDELSYQAEQSRFRMSAIKDFILDGDIEVFEGKPKEVLVLNVLDQVLQEQAENDILLFAATKTLSEDGGTKKPSLFEQRQLVLLQERSEKIGLQIKALNRLLAEVQRGGNENIKRALVNADRIILKLYRKEVDQDILLSALETCLHALQQVREDLGADFTDEDVIYQLSELISRVPTNPISKDFLPAGEIVSTLSAVKDALHKYR